MSVGSRSLSGAFPTLFVVIGGAGIRVMEACRDGADFIGQTDADLPGRIVDAFRSPHGIPLQPPATRFPSRQRTHVRKDELYHCVAIMHFQSFGIA